MFRKLKAEEIDVRVSTINKKGCSLLLYKDARVDMDILDEKVGAMNWQRRHELVGDNLHCTVSIWDNDKQQWVYKSDVGVESFTEKEKGEASDSFKRACFNWGIGRELYTAPFIWVSADKVNLTEKNGKDTTYDKFKVAIVTYTDNKIDVLEIVNQNGEVVFPANRKKRKEPFIEDLEKEQTDREIKELLKLQGLSVMQFHDAYKKKYGKVYLTSSLDDMKTCLADMKKKMEEKK